MDELLERYSPSQQKVIDEYWEVMRKLRKSGKVSDGIKDKELKYWASFDEDLVIEALIIHIDRYWDDAEKTELYTRGIIRKLAKARNSSPQTQQPVRTSRVKKSRYSNFNSREIDSDAIEYIEMLHQTGQLDAKRAELMKNPRYAQYL